MPRKPNTDLDETLETEFVPTPSNAPRLPRPAERDQTLVHCIVFAHNTPVGIVLDPVLNEYNEPILDEKGEPKTAMVERRLQRKERVWMPKWVVDIMVQRDFVEVL